MSTEERKSIKDISWQVSEREYRKYPALSYSILAKYEREGFNNLDKLFDRVESPSLTFGSAVDTLITGNEEDFNNQFMVAQLDNPPSDTLVNITKKLFNIFKDKYQSITDIPDEVILANIEDISWNNHWLPKTRVKKIKEDCNAYYKLLYIADGRTIINSYTYQDVINTVDKLKSSEATRFYFEQNSPFNNDIERFYQLKFKSTFKGVEYKCMADLLITFHNDKTVVPIDLKTSSKPEWDFYKSFIDWRYDVQSRLYWNIIRDNMNKDPFYKDYTLANYVFIVVNKRTLTPLAWKFKHTQDMDDIITKDNKVLRHPFIIGEELKNYLDHKPKVPNGIQLRMTNTIDDFI